MRVCTRTTVRPGDRVTVAIQYSDRPVLRPLIGKLRTVEVTADRRAIIYDEDGRRYQFDGRTIPAVALVEVSIFTDSETGQLWTDSYHLPPRDPSPYPLPARYTSVAEPDGQGGIARIPSCHCGRGCGCPTCGRQTIRVARHLDWSDLLLTSGAAHTGQGCRRPSCWPTGPIDCPDCCAMPMMLAPIGWVCRRDSTHRRVFRWPALPDHTQDVGEFADHVRPHEQEMSRA